MRLERFGFDFWEHRATGMAAPHSHLDVEVNLLLDGQFLYQFGGRECALEPGRLTLFWAGMPHFNPHPSPHRGLWGTIPIRWILERPNLHELCEALLRGTWVVSPAGREAEDARLLAAWTGDLRSGSPNRTAAVELELEARLLRLPPAAFRSARRRSVPATGFERCTALIARRYQDPDLCTADLAADLGLHAKSLLRAFRRQSGMTLWEYITRLRLAHAERLLLTSRQTVLAAAFDAGFGSSSAYYEARKKYHPRIAGEPETRPKRSG